MKFIVLSELDTIMPLLYENFSTLSQDVILSRLRKCLDGDYKIIAAFPKGNDVRAVGLLGMSYVPKMYTGDTLELHHLYIAQEHRGRGLATSLLRMAHNYARMRDIKSVMLDSYLDLEDVHRLYRKLGYSSIGYHFVREI